MFSENNQISGRQVFRLLTYDFLGMGTLLLPTMLADTAGRDGIFCILAGILSTFLYLKLLRYLLKGMKTSYPDFLKQKLAAARLPVKDIRELRKLALQINGPAAAYVRHSDRVVAKVMGRDGKLQENEIDETHFEAYLDTKDIPDPDLLIRTSGEQRLSNYLLWQLAYSEFYFTEVPWPDFHKEELEKAVEAYNKRDRRFGALSEEDGEI